MTLAQNIEVVFEATDRRQAIKLNRITEVETESSWKQLTDRATITLPRKLPYFDAQSVRDTFRRGDRVSIRWGYNGELIDQFTGYVTEVSAAIPIKIKLEDEMWKLKQIAVHYASESVTLPALLGDICPGYRVDAIDADLGGVRFAHTTVAAVLEKLKTDWGLYSYMKGDELVCGKYYADDTATANFHLERNCVSNNLNYRRAEDVLIKITAVSTLANGKKIEVKDIGDKDGQEQRLSFYNIEVEAKLKKLAQAEYDRYKTDGFDGDFTAFGLPDVRHGMKVDLKSDLYDDRDGTYYVDSVRKQFGQGIRQTVKLGKRV